MICKSCGAKFDDKEAKCPFCGTMNEKGSKKLFSRKLIGITDTIGDMSEQPKKVLVKNTVAALCVAAACLLIGISIALSVRFQNQQHDRTVEIKEEKEKVKKIIWENETFPMLDEWYEKGEFAPIRDLYYKLLDEDSENDLCRWRHYSFLEIYNYYYDIEQYIKQQQNQEIVEEIDNEMVLQRAMQLIYAYSEDELANQTPKDPKHSTWGLTYEELELIAKYKNDAQMVITEFLKMTKEEQETLYQECKSSSYYGACYDYAKKMGW